MKRITELADQINIRALSRRNQKLFKMIEHLETGGATVEFMMTLLDCSIATVYRLIPLANDLMWNFKIEIDEGRMKMIKRKNK